MNLFGKITEILTTPITLTRSRNEWVEYAVQMTDPRIASASGYTKTLLPCVEQALGYFTESIARIPGPLALGSPGSDAITPECCSDGLSRSLAARQQLPELLEAGHQRIYTLLGMRTKTGDDGKTLFVDHTFRDFCDSPEGVREALQQAAFDSLLQGFANETGHRMKKLELMQNQKALIQETGSSRHASAGQPIEAHISRASQELSPDVVLDNLAAWLRAPEDTLRVNTHHILADVKVPLDLPMLATQDRRQWLVCLLEIPANFARDALAKANHAHRFILI